MLKTSLAFALACSIALAGAQEKKPATPAAPQKPAAAAPAPLPQATELEKAKLENLQLRMMLLNQEEQSLPERKNQIQQQYGELIREIEAAHPGFAWNPSANTLIPKPAPKPAPVAPAEAPKK